MGEAAWSTRIGGLKVRNKSITARVMGDVAQGNTNGYLNVCNYSITA